MVTGPAGRDVHTNLQTGYRTVPRVANLQKMNDVTAGKAQHAAHAVQARQLRWEVLMLPHSVAVQRARLPGKAPLHVVCWASPGAWPRPAQQRLCCTLG